LYPITLHQLLVLFSVPSANALLAHQFLYFHESIQDRFGTGAATLNGGTVVRTDAWGKHLFVRIDPSPTGPHGGTAAAGRAVRSGRTIWLHIHLGLYGRFTIGHGEAPAPQGALRLRLESERGWADLRGAITCELLDDEQRDVLISRLGEDPLQKKADPLRPWARIGVVAGLGHIRYLPLVF